MQPAELALVLHAHLPFVRHPEHEFFLEENWLYEAITETYIPLLTVLEGLERDDVPFELSMVLSPPLCEMLDDPLLRQRYTRHLSLLQTLCEREAKRVADHGHLSYLVTHYRERFAAIAETWRRNGGDLLSAFGALQERGRLDILTCAATHGYLPLMQHTPEAVHAQLAVAVDSYRRRFGRAPTGIWLPECAYYEGLDALLAEVGLRYFIADTHGVLYATPRPRHGSLAPLFCRQSGVAVFARDPDSSNEVWSRERGYPGDAVYRDFYRDIGFDLDADALAPFDRPHGVAKHTGIKYHRITGAAEHKELYDPYWAERRAREHARDFLYKRLAQTMRARDGDLYAPLVVAPYDAELFGHWWYEGPWWLDELFRRLPEHGDHLRPTHLRSYLQRHATQQLAQPAQSSWGERGYHEYWLNDTNEWIYPRLTLAAERMIELASREQQPSALEARALDQAARELLLAQASDWAFIMRTKTTVDYAVRRTRSHLARFWRLADEIARGDIDPLWLSHVEQTDSCFAHLDYRVYARR